jgi:hypothetical protein
MGLICRTCDQRVAARPTSVGGDSGEFVISGGRSMRWRGVQGDPMNMSGAWTDGKDFERRVGERDDSDEAVLGGSGTVFFLGFDWYRYQIETMRGRRRTEKDRARVTPEILAAPENIGE